MNLDEPDRPGSEAPSQQPAKVLAFPTAPTRSITDETLGEILGEIRDGQAETTKALQGIAKRLDTSSLEDRVAALEAEVPELREAVGRIGSGDDDAFATIVGERVLRGDFFRRLERTWLDDRLFALESEGELYWERDEALVVVQAEHASLRKELVELANQVELIKNPNAAVRSAARQAASGDGAGLAELAGLIRKQQTWWDRHGDVIIAAGLTALGVAAVAWGVASHRAYRRALADRERAQQRTRQVEREYLTLHGAYVQQRRALASEQARPLMQVDRHVVTNNYDQRELTTYDQREFRTYDQHVEHNDNRTIEQAVDVAALGRELARHVPPAVDSATLVRQVAEFVDAKLARTGQADPKALAREVARLVNASGGVSIDAKVFAKAIARHLRTPDAVVDVNALAQELRRRLPDVAPQRARRKPDVAPQRARRKPKIVVKIERSPEIDAALAELKKQA